MCIATYAIFLFLSVARGEQAYDAPPQCLNDASSTAPECSHALLQFVHTRQKGSDSSPPDENEVFKEEDPGISAVELGSPAKPGNVVVATTVDCDAQARACAGKPGCSCDTVCPCSQQRSKKATIVPKMVKHLAPAPAPVQQEEEVEEAPAPAPVTRAVEPSGPGCNPVCRWKCEQADCDQACTPVCSQPKCETRCRKSTKGCGLVCNEPECHTTCPERQCPTKECPACQTTCSKPVCRLKCPQMQNCKAVCAQPNCKWQCKNSNCPPPKCKMVCAAPKKCNMQSAGEDLPSLQPGEVSVKSFVAPVRGTKLDPSKATETEDEEEDNSTVSTTTEKPAKKTTTTTEADTTTTEAEEEEADNSTNSTVLMTAKQPAQMLQMELSVNEDYVDSHGTLQHRIVKLPVLA
eukprot:gnl/TRDRNA2_/TRDRNA2_86081_c0_seq3.p1 gnl/TRDRNA2_/TRDRNA2_86081_c0~~gnl/TRDRNA2_/TRDRNA2_86081_c0_seq3.p1  ORF type:complete len:428 (+),score=53.94 gnl/TRDRNA2_/TRDRNA2_86081_c0_seq3:67-1284(+)